MSQNLGAPLLKLQVAGWLQILLVSCCNDMQQQFGHAVRCAGRNNSKCGQLCSCCMTCLSVRHAQVYVCVHFWQSRSHISMSQERHAEKLSMSACKPGSNRCPAFCFLLALLLISLLVLCSLLCHICKWLPDCIHRQTCAVGCS